MEVAARIVRQFWPNAIFENGLTGDRYESFTDIPFRETEELFVYRDVAAADAWDAEGAIPSLYNTMIHVIADPGYITIVVDEKDELVQRMTEAIASALVGEVSSK